MMWEHHLNNHIHRNTGLTLLYIKFDFDSSWLYLKYSFVRLYSLLYGFTVVISVVRLWFNL